MIINYYCIDEDIFIGDLGIKFVYLCKCKDLSQKFFKIQREQGLKSKRINDKIYLAK